MDGVYNGGQTGSYDNEADAPGTTTTTEDVAAPAAVIEMEEQKQFVVAQAAPVIQQPQIVVVQQPPSAHVQAPQTIITESTLTQRRRPSGVAPSKTVATNSNLWENMSPWTGNEGFYGFYCKTDFDELETKARERKNMIKAHEFRSEHFRAISVYHKKESSRLIIKTKDSGAGLFKTRRNGPLLYGGLFAGLIALIFLIVAGASNGDNVWGWPMGAVLIIVAIIMIVCSGARKLRVDKAEYLTNLVPIHDIKFVEREASTIEFTSKKCCQKDDAEDPEFRTSRIAIGFSRSNLSSQLVPGSATEDDYIELILQANDAYNLHQYINWYIDS